MRIIAIDRLADLDLFDIYRVQDERHALTGNTALRSDQAVELAVGLHLLEDLRQRIHDAMAEGHTHIMLSLHQRAAQAMVAGGHNFDCITRGAAWTPAPELASSSAVSELNLHEELRDQAAAACASGDIEALLDGLEDLLVERLAANQLVFTMVVPQAVLELLAD